VPSRSVLASQPSAAVYTLSIRELSLLPHSRHPLCVPTSVLMFVPSSYVACLPTQHLQSRGCGVRCSPNSPWVVWASVPSSHVVCLPTQHLQYRGCGVQCSSSSPWASVPSSHVVCLPTQHLQYRGCGVQCSSSSPWVVWASSQPPVAMCTQPTCELSLSLSSRHVSSHVPAAVLILPHVACSPAHRLQPRERGSWSRPSQQGESSHLSAGGALLCT
jgi:hypothetical protein